MQLACTHIPLSISLRDDGEGVFAPFSIRSNKSRSPWVFSLLFSADLPAAAQTCPESFTGFPKLSKPRCHHIWPNNVKWRVKRILLTDLIKSILSNYMLMREWIWKWSTRGGINPMLKKYRFRKRILTKIDIRLPWNLLKIDTKRLLKGRIV